MANPPLLRSVRLALSLGAAIGAALGAWFAISVLGEGWWWAGTIGGAVFGFISGFDALIPGPGRRIGHHPRDRVGPFRGGTSCVIAAVACFVAGFWARGHVELRCDRGAEGVECARRYHGWIGSTVTGEQRWSGVTGVWDGGPSRIVLILADGQRGIVDGFGPEYLEPVGEWLKSDSRELVFRSEALGFFSPLFFVLSVVVGLLGLHQLRRGLRMLRQQFAKGVIA